MVPRHPVQLYEAAAYLFVFFILQIQARQHAALSRRGYLTGLFLLLVFGFRAVFEIFKVPQTAYEDEYVISIGQLLSIPFVLVGVALIIRAYLTSAESEMDAKYFQKNQPANRGLEPSDH